MKKKTILALTTTAGLIGIGIGIYFLGMYFLSYTERVNRAVSKPTPQVSVLPVSTLTSSGLSVDSKIDNILVLVNQERIKRGLPILRYSAKVTAGANERASNLYFVKKELTHDGLSQALRKAGLYNWYSECLASDYASDIDVVDAWVASPKHAEKMFDERCTIAGVGRAGRYIVLWLGICGQPK